MAKKSNAKKFNRRSAMKMVNKGMMLQELHSILRQIQAESDRQGKIAVSVSDSALDTVHNLATEAIAEVHGLISPMVETPRRNGL